MSTHLLLPDFGDSNISTKDKIISILSSHPDLTTRKIHHMLKKLYATDVTYQAVHKLIKQMVNSEVLKEENHLYSINKKWIARLSSFVNKFSDMRNHLEGAPSLDYRKIAQSAEIQKLTVNSRSEFDEVYYKLRKELILNMKTIPENERIIFRSFWHLYYPLVHPAEEYELQKLAEEVGAHGYTFVGGNTPMDKWATRVYKDTVMKAYLGVSLTNTNMLFIYGDTMMEVFYSPRWIKLFDEVFNNTRNINNFKLNSVLNQLYTIKDPIILTINKDPVIVNTMKNLFKDQLAKINRESGNISGHYYSFEEIMNSALMKEHTKQFFWNSKNEGYKTSELIYY